jgi:8-amino-7-oxononanoate synthase
MKQVREMGDHGFRDTLICRLKNIREKNLYRRIQPVEGPQGEWITIRGQRTLSLSSNNYLGLANHPTLKKAAAQAIEELGCGAGASRLISGSMVVHEELETRLAQFKKTEAALVFPTGYHANLGTLSALMGQGDIIFSDARNHASIIDGCRLSGASVKVFRHSDMDHLKKLLKEYKAYRHRLIVVDTVFSMDGDIAPLSDIVELAKTHNAWVMVDEAHATGVFGPTGAGIVEELGLSQDIDIQMGTLGKALGCIGAYVAGNSDLIEWLTNRSRSFIYTTALLPSAAATALAALELVQKEPIRRIQLMGNASLLRNELSQLGFDLGKCSSQILPILIGSEKTTLSLQEELFNRGVWGQAVRPPTIPMGTSRIRLTPMATHTESQLKQVITAFSESGRALGIL